MTDFLAKSGNLNRRTEAANTRDTEGRQELVFAADLCYTVLSKEMESSMQIIVLNGTLSEAEQDDCIRQAAKVYPINIIEKLFLDVQDSHIDIRCELHQFHEMRKMGGYCAGNPDNWNPAKQSELRDTLPNPID